MLICVSGKPRRKEEVAAVARLLVNVHAQVGLDCVSKFLHANYNID